MVVFAFVHLLGDFFLEAVSEFESGYIVSRNNECGVLADVAGCFLSTGLDDERTEATEIYVLAVCETIFTTVMNCSITVTTSALSMPVVFAISLAISALVISVLF